MKQRKKLFTRMLINNWGGIDHKVIEFHEYVNLFSGKSGSGKSTVMDALQVVLYGSVRNDFFNRAADDTKNKRSVLSYLRGAQKDGTSNRGDQDFYAQLVLEILDTANQSNLCIGVFFEVGKNDVDLKKYHFFSHLGKIPEDQYLFEGKIPYSYVKLQNLIKERALSKENKSRGNLNRIYPTRESYLNALNDVIFGYVDGGRFKTMQKSAIALRMTNGTSQFIKDYMFPKSKEDTISAISDQLAAYREIKEQIEILEKEIDMLIQIQDHNIKLVNNRALQEETETYLKILEIKEKETHLQAGKEDLERVTDEISCLDRDRDCLKDKLEEEREKLLKVQVELKSSDLERKKEDLSKVQQLIESAHANASDWRQLVKRLKLWEETEVINDYLSNTLLHRMENIIKGDITEERIEKLKYELKETCKTISEELDDLKEKYKETYKKREEKQEILDDLKKDKKHYRKELKSVRQKLQQKLADLYGKSIKVEIFADLFDIKEEEWRNAIEGRLGRMKYALVVEPSYSLQAAKMFREMKGVESENIDLINTAAILRDKPTARSGTLYEAVTAENGYVDGCLKRYLGFIQKCETVEELHEVKNGVTKDCYSYNNYMFSHLRKQDYQYPVIGRKISLKQRNELEEEIYQLDEKLLQLGQEKANLEPVSYMERLESYQYEQMFRLFSADGQLKKYNQQAEQLQKEIQELEKGTRMEGLLIQEKELKESVKEKEEHLETLNKKENKLSERKGIIEKEVRDKKESLESLLLGYIPNQKLEEEVETILNQGEAGRYKQKKKRQLEQLKQEEEKEENARYGSRMQYLREFPMRDFAGVEKENTVYDQRLEECRKDFEPKYKEEFEQQYRLVYQMLRENVIATIHSEIKAAKRHRREINDMLRKISFSDSVYQIDIQAAEDENKQFYEMLTAEELDMKVLHIEEMEGQIIFGEDEFYQKYEPQIRRLTEKFMPPKDSDQSVRDAFKKNMEKYADYRTYLNFRMYERTENKQGEIKKNYVDDMAGLDSGGEGQNPKYVALLAGFAMLYMQQSNRDSKIRLVLLDEAFSKMDKERSEVCLHYARQLGLQMIVCVPDERLQSLIRNVDSVHAFRRFQNRISMIRIDKGDYFNLVEGNGDEENYNIGTVDYSENQ